MKTAELYRRLGCANNMLHRLAERGILRPERVPAAVGAHRWGYVFEWDDAEQRVARAVVMLARALLIEVGRRDSTASEARDDALRSVADAARAALPDPAPRWLVLFADGSCVRGDDDFAASVGGHRTLIELEEIAAKA